MNNLNSLTKEEFNSLINIKFSNITEGFNKYNSFMLHCIDESLPFPIKESMFVDFFNESLLANDNFAVIDFYLKDLSSDEILTLMNSLDYDNKLILIDQLKALKDDSIYFSLDNTILMKFITTLNTKNLFFSTIYFKNIPITIWGNYDLKFPVFFNDISNFNTYKDIASKYGLTFS